MLVEYGDDIDSEIEAGCIKRAENGDAHDRSCTVSQNENSAREAFVADARKDSTKVKEKVHSRD